MRKRSSKKGVWKRIKWIQSKIDITPYMIKLSNSVAKKGSANVFLFFFFILAGFFGLFIPILQGWLTIALAFTFLGIKPVNKFIQKNRKGVENVGTFMFSATMVILLGSTALWMGGIVETSPVQGIMKVVQLGQESLEGSQQQAFSIIGLDYMKIQQSFSIVDYTETQGFSIIGI